jgi:periplasmic divalent cation tolerance protein
MYKYERSYESHMLAIYIPCTNNKEAQKISLALLKKKLIACANIIPASSFYLWKGSIENSEEFVIIGKTMEEKFPALEKHVSMLHSYECPCIAAWKIDHVNKKYHDFVKASLEK